MIPNGPKIYLQTVGTSDRIHTVLTNPNNFESFSDYYITLEKIIGTNIIRNAQVKRFDIAVDFKQTFNDLLKYIDVSYKAITSATAFKSSSINWVTFGKSESGEFIKIYDKTSHFKCCNPISRVEVQYTTPKIKKIPLKTVYDLMEGIQKGLLERLLKNIKIRHCEFITKTNDKELLRDKEKFLKGALSIAPISIVRRRLNSNGNFARDYRKTLTFHDYNIQFYTIAHIGINQWIEKGSEYES
jgi:hypothetical protein